MANQTIEIIEARWGESLVLELKGRFDANTSNEVQEKLTSLIEKGYIRLALDFSELEYISSAGLRVLLTALKKLKICHGKMILFGLNAHLKQIFHIAGFVALFPIYGSAEEFRGAFRWAEPLSRFVIGDRTSANRGAYFGETIDIDALLKELREAAEGRGWLCEPFLGEEGCQLLAFSRHSNRSNKSIYLSSGIHGDEPAPPLAMLDLIWHDNWPQDWNIYICPCLNPSGFRTNKRVNAEGIDLNRDYFESKSKEIRAHVDWLERQPTFSIAVSLHEDWESLGFYVYQLGQLEVDPVMHHILDAVAAVCTIDQSPAIDYLPAENGILDLAFHSLQANEKLIDALAEGAIETPASPQPTSIWSEPIFLINRKTKISYTFESASAFPLDIRVAGLVRAVNALLTCPYGSE